VFEKNYRLQDIQLSKIRRRPSGFGETRPRSLAGLVKLFKSRNAAKAFAPDMVENTGLEPVTSWLQTRRSPS
jgi:hypothetical protein